MGVLAHVGVGLPVAPTYRASAARFDSVVLSFIFFYLFYFIVISVFYCYYSFTAMLQVFMECFMAIASDTLVLSKDDRKIVVSALALYEASVNRAIKGAAAPVVAEAHGKVLADVQRVSALFR